MNKLHLMFRKRPRQANITATQCEETKRQKNEINKRPKEQQQQKLGRMALSVRMGSFRCGGGAGRVLFWVCHSLNSDALCSSRMLKNILIAREAVMNRELRSQRSAASLAHQVSDWLLCSGLEIVCSSLLHSRWLFSQTLQTQTRLCQCSKS